jgi:hypothetical protein
MRDGVQPSETVIPPTRSNLVGALSALVLVPLITLPLVTLFRHGFASGQSFLETLICGLGGPLSAYVFGTESGLKPLLAAFVSLLPALLCARIASRVGDEHAGFWIGFGAIVSSFLWAFWGVFVTSLL